MSDSPKLPARADGPPIPGDAGVASLVPFGLDQVKPHHFREMAGVFLENRDNLGYAWRILNHGVCDGCSLGPRGLQDDVIPGTHLCMSRLKLLRNNTIGPFVPADVMDIGRLRRMTNDELRDLGRVPYPFVYRPGDRGFSRVGWDEALGLIGERLQDIPPERQAYFATSKGLTNETYYTFTKAARLMGTNNVDFCARLCHAATVAGLSRTIGVGAPTLSLNDLIGTDLILLWGTNLANNQPVSVKYLHYAKQAGTRIVVINAVPERGLESYWIPSITSSALFGSRLMDDFVRVKVGGDLALMNAVMKLLVSWGAVDRAYIDAHTAGFDAMVTHLEGLDMRALCEEAGVPISRVEWLATLIARAKDMVTVYSMGLTQHVFGTQNVMGVVNLHLSQGALGKPKNGILPIRGHSGVQGGGECGVTPTKYPGGFAVNEENAARFTELWGFPVPHSAGLATGPMLDAAHRGEIDFLYNVGGNLLGTMPEPKWVAEAFARVKLRIHQDINLNSSTLLDPGELLVVLPAQTRYEQRGGGTSTSTERRIRFSPEIPGHPQVGEARPEWEIPGLVVAAARPALARAFDYADSQDIRDEMGEVMPVYAGIEDLRREGDWIQWGGPQLCRDGDFANMPEGRARFSALDTPRIAIPEGWFYMTTRRGKQFNSMVFAEEDTLQGGLRRDDVFLSAEDARQLGVSEGEAVTLSNDVGEMKGVARLVGCAPGTIQTYWPEGNVLIERRWDPLSQEPDYNVLVQIRKG
ncbi:MAG: molybdopterin-dependent oxidoreductase [Alphaproteobacteria bacterium]|nr:molybdopterin-dependent oxidoreductase [Alphaproteobacteria bacterium]